MYDSELVNMIAEYKQRLDDLERRNSINDVSGSPVSAPAAASFAATPHQGLSQYRSDLYQQFHFDGTYWLGPEVEVMLTPIYNVVWPTTTNSIITHTMIVPYDMRITSVFALMQTSVNNTGVNYWFLNFTNILTGTQSSIGNVNSATGTTANVFKRFVYSPAQPGTYINSANLSDMSVVATFAGTAGSLNAYCGLTYRRIMY